LWGAGPAQGPARQSGWGGGGGALQRGVQTPPPPAQLTASPRLCHPRTAAGCPPGAGTRVERLVGGAPSVARLLLTTTAWPPPPRMAGPADAQRLCLCAWRLPVGRASLYSRPHPKPLLSLLPPLNAHSESKRLDARPPQAICQSREDPRPAPSIRHRSCQPIAHVQCFGGSIVLCQPQGDALLGGRRQRNASSPGRNTAFVGVHGGTPRRDRHEPFLADHTQRLLIGPRRILGRIFS